MISAGHLPCRHPTLVGLFRLETQMFQQLYRCLKDLHLLVHIQCNRPILAYLQLIQYIKNTKIN